MRLFQDLDLDLLDNVIYRYLTKNKFVYGSPKTIMTFVVQKIKFWRLIDRPKPRQFTYFNSQCRLISGIPRSIQLERDNPVPVQNPAFLRINLIHPRKPIPNRHIPPILRYRASIVVRNLHVSRVFQSRLEVIRGLHQLHLVVIFVDVDLHAVVLSSTRQGLLDGHVDHDGAFVFVVQPQFFCHVEVHSGGAVDRDHLPDGVLEDRLDHAGVNCWVNCYRGVPFYFLAVRVTEKRMLRPGFCACSDVLSLDICCEDVFGESDVFRRLNVDDEFR